MSTTSRGTADVPLQCARSRIVLLLHVLATPPTGVCRQPYMTQRSCAEDTALRDKKEFALEVRGVGCVLFAIEFHVQLYRRQVPCRSCVDDVGEVVLQPLVAKLGESGTGHAIQRANLLRMEPFTCFWASWIGVLKAVCFFISVQHPTIPPLEGGENQSIETAADTVFEF